MREKGCILLTGVSVALWAAWSAHDRQLNQLLVDYFSLSEWSTIQQGRLQTVLLYPLCHSSTLHLAANVATYMTIGRAVERLEGGAILFKLGAIAGPLGFVMAYSLRNSSSATTTSSLQSLRGGGCLSSAFTTYFLAKYWSQTIAIGRWSVPGQVLGLGLLACESFISCYWAGNRTFDLELGGALAAAYFIFAQRIVIR